MGTNNLPTATGGTVIPSSDHNAIKEALSGDLVPRNSSGVPTSEAGSLGTTSFQFKSARIQSGYLSVGDIKQHHSFNNTVKCGQGWFPCTGGVINEANYDAYHGAGSWDSYIISSLLENKYAPNFTNKYPVGVSTATQTGASAITPVGNTSHQVNLSHNHSVAAHVHQWYANGQSDQSDITYNSGGSPVALPAAAAKINTSYFYIARANAASVPIANAYTSSNGGGSTGDNLSATQSVQPESIQVEYFIRIVE